MTPVAKQADTTRIIKTWKQANRLSIRRSDPSGIYTGAIDVGANYFVLMLEQLGAKTLYSCEGHPNNFYVMFEAPYDIALAVASYGYFLVEVEDRDQWSLRMRAVESNEERCQILTYAANAWTKAFGPIYYKPERQYAPLARADKRTQRHLGRPHR